jgi:hypothetical protein
MYLLDANAFMEANRLYDAFDLAPGDWATLTAESDRQIERDMLGR